MYPNSQCRYHPEGHHYKQVIGNIWRCKYCWAVKWQPKDFPESIMCSADVAVLGIQAAYRKWLRYRPKVKELLGKLEEVRLLREIMPRKELMRMVAAIMVERRKDEHLR